MTEKIAEVTVGQYYAYKAKVRSLDRAMWYDRNGIVVDSALELLLEELARTRPLRPEGGVREEVEEIRARLQNDIKIMKRQKDNTPTDDPHYQYLSGRLDVSSTVLSLLPQQEGKGE